MFNKLVQSRYWKDILWQASGNSAAQLVGIGAMPILTRLYVPEQFAVQALFLQAVTILSILITWRYEHFIHLAKNESESAVILKILVCVSVSGVVVLTPIMYLFGLPLANLLNNPDLGPWLVIAPSTAMVASLAVAFQQKMQRAQDFRGSGLSELVNKIGYCATGIIGSYIFRSAAGLLLAPLFGTLSKLLLILKLLTQKNRSLITQIRFANGAFSLLPRFFRLSCSLVYSHLMLAVTNGAPLIFIAKIYGANTLGQFSLVIATLYLPTSLIGRAIGQVFYQRASKNFFAGASFYRLWFSTVSKLLFIGVPIFLFIGFIAPWMYPIAFGNSWTHAGEYARLLSISAFFSFVATPTDRTYVITDAWIYIAIWHTLRAATTLFVGGVAWALELEFGQFLYMLIAQMSVLYLIDLFFQSRYSKLVFE